MTDDETPDGATGHDPGAPAARGPLQGLEDINELLADRRLDPGTFARGLSLGILVGSAVAGLELWRRWRSTSRPPRSR